MIHADSTRFDTDTLTSLKEATAHLRLKLSDDSVVEGSGFFAREPGMVVTNARVLGMLDANSRQPLHVDVTILAVNVAELPCARK